ncbi:LCP family protein [Actinomadura chokoriensis]|uniref:LCP family protein n=1 Tax=Actinomadura chokoriensis TaxID=454156 RepID=A0ABV4QNX3_9ACTN
MSDKDPARDEDLARDKAAHKTSRAPHSTGPGEAGPDADRAPDRPRDTEDSDPKTPKETATAATAPGQGGEAAGDGIGAAPEATTESAPGEGGSAGTAAGEGSAAAAAGASEEGGRVAADSEDAGGDAAASGQSGGGAKDGQGGAGANDGQSGGGAKDGQDGQAPGRAGGGRRKVLRRVAAGAVFVLLLGGGGAAWLYHDLVGGIEQEHVDDKLGANRPKKLNKSLNILLIGSDTREGDNARYGAAAGMSGARSDTTILLHLSPNRDQAVGISFPRDSMVKMPSCKKEKGGTVPAQFGMLNAAFAYAGPTCTWKTLESLTGIHIDHFVQVDFAGFKRMVDALGGVQICVSRPVNDPRAELYLKAGKQTVKGEEALGYVRARYSLGDGSDLERIERQQKFMASVVDKATSGSVLTDPAKTYKFLKAATKSMTTDDDLDLAAMRKLADGLKGMSAGQVRFVTVPVKGYAPDPNRVQWNQELAKPLFEAIQHDSELPAEPAKPVKAQAAPLAPGKVHVTVVAAGGKDGLVKRIVKQLEHRGYEVAKKVEKGDKTAESRLVYAPAAEPQASALARDVPNAMLTADAKAPQDGVRLVIGTGGVQLAPPAINKIGGGVKAGEKLCG